MAVFNVGDRVIVNSRADWPEPPGYRFAGAEGTVASWVRYSGPLEGFSDFVYVHIGKADVRAEVYVGGSYYFRAEDLIKVVSASEAAL